MAVPSASAAQGLPSDPEADSPSGVVYELPVDRARKDAAPKREKPQSPSVGGGDSFGGGDGPSSGVGGVTETSIRSENNFGTSSEVPGAGADGKRAGAGSKRDGDQGRGPVERVADVTARSTVAASDGPSDGVVYPLLAVLVAVGVGIGGFAGYRSLRSPRG
jgi:hypothetical protein